MGVLIFQVLMSLILGMMFYIIYRLITHDETFEKLYNLLNSSNEKKRDVD